MSAVKTKTKRCKLCGKPIVRLGHDLCVDCRLPKPPPFTTKLITR